MPSLHNTSATGATIKETPTILKDVQISGLRKIRRIDNPENPIQRISLISLFFRSKKDANPSITNAAIILTMLISERPSNIRSLQNIYMTCHYFPKLVEQSYI